MINMAVLPCSNCERFCGIKQEEKKEETEYVCCEVAEGHRADNLLKREERTITCKKQVKVDDD